MDRMQWPLEALYESEDGRLSPVQIQKTLFLVGANLPDEMGSDYYHFEPYHYGPFDSAIYEDLEHLVEQGFVMRVASSKHSGKDFEITPEGRRAIERQRPSAAVSTYIKSVVAWMRPLSFSALVSAIYTKYPEFKVNSVFRG